VQAAGVYDSQGGGTARKLPDDEALKVLRVMSVSAALSRHI